MSAKINIKIYDIINCLIKKLITHFVSYLEKEKRYDIEKTWKNHAENVQKKLVPDPCLILENNPKQPLHARNSFKNKIF